VSFGIAAFALNVAIEGWQASARSAVALAFALGTVWANGEFAFAPLAAIRSPGVRSIGTLAVMAVAYTTIFIRHPHPFYVLFLTWLPVAAVYMAIFLIPLFRGRG
jgi:hypothetical protein